jgi:hypothetical protein
MLVLGTAMGKHAPCMQLKQYIASKLTYSEYSEAFDEIQTHAMEIKETQ